MEGREERERMERIKAYSITLYVVFYQLNKCLQYEKLPKLRECISFVHKTTAKSPHCEDNVFVVD